MNQLHDIHKFTELLLGYLECVFGYPPRYPHRQVSQARAPVLPGYSATTRSPEALWASRRAV